MCTVQAPQPRHLIKGHFRVTGAWDQAIPSNPATGTCAVCGEKGGAGIEETYLIHPDDLISSRLARFPKFESREIRGERNNLSD